MITMGSLKTIRKTGTFGIWIESLKDVTTRVIIGQRIERLKRGLGDVKPAGEGVLELRIDVGPGWRIYLIEVEGQIILLLAGGSKKSQAADIDAAKQMVRDLRAQVVMNRARRKAALAPKSRKPKEKS